MLWIWLLARNSVRWGTGPLDRYFAFICARCGANTPAMVRTFGFGSGPNLWAAQQRAAYSADTFAYRATCACACPSCGELQPQILGQFAAAAKRAESRAKLRIPLTLAFAVVTLLFLAIPAVRDLRHSAALTAVALSTSVAVGALVFAIMSATIMTPGTNPSGVWFSRDPSMGPNSWFPAQPGPAPFVPQPSALFRGLSFATLAVTGLSAIIGLIVWSTTFQKVYVVSSDGQLADLSVKIDGENVGSVKGLSATGDAPFESFEVRTDDVHHMIVTGPNGRQDAYDLDPNGASHGWLVAPHGRERGMCVATITWYYGRSPSKDEDDSALLNKDADMVALPHSFDYVFVRPPSSIQTQNGSSETKKTIRALDCASLAKENIVPFRDRH